MSIRSTTSAPTKPRDTVVEPPPGAPVPKKSIQNPKLTPEAKERAKSSGDIHTVNKGDTLWSVWKHAQSEGKTNVDFAGFRAANMHIANASALAVGDELVIPKSADAFTRGPAAPTQKQNPTMTPALDEASRDELYAELLEEVPSVGVGEAPTTPDLIPALDNPNQVAANIYDAVHGVGTKNRKLEENMKLFGGATPEERALVSKEFVRLSGGETLFHAVKDDVKGKQKTRMLDYLYGNREEAQMDIMVRAVRGMNTPAAAGLGDWSSSKDVVEYLKTIPEDRRTEFAVLYHAECGRTVLHDLSEKHTPIDDDVIRQFKHPQEREDMVASLKLGVVVPGTYTQEGGELVP